MKDLKETFQPTVNTCVECGKLDKEQTTPDTMGVCTFFNWGIGRKVGAKQALCKR